MKLKLYRSSEDELTYSQLVSKSKKTDNYKKIKKSLLNLTSHRIVYQEDSLVRALERKGVICNRTKGIYTNRPYIKLNYTQNLKIFTNTRVIRLFSSTGNDVVLDIINIPLDQAVDIIVENLEPRKKGMNVLWNNKVNPAKETNKAVGISIKHNGFIKIMWIPKSQIIGKVDLTLGNIEIPDWLWDQKMNELF